MIIIIIEKKKSVVGGPPWSLQSSRIVKVFPALFLFSSSVVSRPSFCITLTIDKKLVSMSLASFVASDMRVHFQWCIWSLLNCLKDLSTRSLFGDVMLFCPWNLTDVANLLIATPLSGEIIAACWNFVFTEERNFCQSLLWGLPLHYFLFWRITATLVRLCFQLRNLHPDKNPGQHVTSYLFCHLCVRSPISPSMKKLLFQAARITPHNRKTMGFNCTSI